jgi:hypothetical protein
MNAIAMPRRAFGLLVKFSVRMGPIINAVQMKMLSPFSSRIRWRSWKNWIVPGSLDEDP